MPGAISAKLHGEPKPRKGPKTPLTFIVTAYNIEDYIDRALSSVVDQGVEGAEIIVIDDGSTDRTLHKIATFLKGEPKARLISQVNAGPGAARNVALAEASGDYVLFLDGDDWLAPGCAEALLKAARAGEGVDLVFSNRRRYWEVSGNYTTKPVFSDKSAVHPSEMGEMMRVMAIHGKLFRRRFLTENEILFPAGMTSEDYVFSYHAYARAERVSSIAGVTYFYRKRGGSDNRSITQQRLSEFNLESRFRQIEMTQDLVTRFRMDERFADEPFARGDYDTRLMRHVLTLPIADARTRARGLEMIRDFLSRHRDAAQAAVRDGTWAIYDHILNGRDDQAVALIAKARAKSKVAQATMP